MQFKIYRDGLSWRFVKVVIELWDGDVRLDRRRMRSFPLVTFAKRLERRKRRMLRCADIMKQATL